MRDPGSALPPGWSLVVIERRRQGGGPFDISRRRWLLCPFHADFISLDGVRRRRQRAM